MNVHTISGNLGRDAELRYAQSGTAVLNFSVPMKSGYGDRGKTDWVRCAMFGKRAEGKLVEYMKKGQPVVVTGETYLSSWTNKEGVEKTNLEMNVQEVTLMGGKQQAQGGGGETEPGPGELDDAIPFITRWGNK